MTLREVRAVRTIQRFRTTDGYTLYRIDDEWRDGLDDMFDLTFASTPDGLPKDDITGDALDGTLDTVELHRLEYFQGNSTHTMHVPASHYHKACAYLLRGHESDSAEEREMILGDVDEVLVNFPEAELDDILRRTEAAADLADSLRHCTGATTVTVTDGDARAMSDRELARLGTIGELQRQDDAQRADELFDLTRRL